MMWGELRNCDFDITFVFRPYVKTTGDVILKVLSVTDDIHGFNHVKFRKFQSVVFEILSLDQWGFFGPPDIYYSNTTVYTAIA